MYDAKIDFQDQADEVWVTKRSGSYSFELQINWKLDGKGIHKQVIKSDAMFGPVVSNWSECVVSLVEYVKWWKPLPTPHPDTQFMAMRGWERGVL